MAEDLASFVRDMDACWLEGRFDDLRSYLADDIVIAAPGGHRASGVEAAVESYREFTSRCVVHAFETSGHVTTLSGSSGVVEYEWRMSWSDGADKHDAEGREVLVLNQSDGNWRVIWRMQVPA